MKLTLTVPPSVNHCYVNTRFGKRVLSKIGKAWKERTQDIASTEAKKQKWFIKPKRKVVMEIWTWFPDNRRRDCHNGAKLLCDALENIIIDDDKYLLPRYMDVGVDRDNPRVDLIIYELEGKQ